MRIKLFALLFSLLSLSVAAPALADGAPGASNAARLDSLETQAGRLAQRSDDWSGSLRYRWQAERRGGLVRDNRLSQQLELKLGFAHHFSDELRFGLRISALGGDGFARDNFNYDPNFALGASGNPFAGAQLTLDQAFVKYSPDWAGHYVDGSGRDKPRVDVIGGRFAD